MRGQLLGVARGGGSFRDNRSSSALLLAVRSKAGGPVSRPTLRPGGFAARRRLSAQPSQLTQHHRPPFSSEGFRFAFSGLAGRRFRGPPAAVRYRGTAQRGAGPSAPAAALLSHSSSFSRLYFFLKVVSPLRAVIAAALHTTVLESGGSIRTDTSRCGRVSRPVPCSRARSACLVSHASPTGILSAACSSVQNNTSPSPSLNRFLPIVHLPSCPFARHFLLASIRSDLSRRGQGNDEPP